MRLTIKFLKSALIAFVFFYVLLCGYVWFLQTSLIHHPSRYLTDDIVKLSKKRPDLKLWPDTAGYRGIIGEPEKGQNIIGTVVIFHGNAGSVLERIWYADALKSIGYRVILHEHPGYGARDGTLDEMNLVKDGSETVHFARLRFGSPIYIIGESLGSGVASGVIARTGADGAILIVPWDKMANVAKKFYWYLPVDMLLSEKYDSVENLKNFKGPLAVVMAEKDEIIPPECSMNLYDSFSGEKRLWISNGEGHNTWNSIATHEFWKAIMAFISGKAG